MSASHPSPQTCSPRDLTVLLVVACCIHWFMHLQSYYGEHQEGDELVYSALAAEMEWDCSNYTIKDHPLRKYLPESIKIYDQDVFHHPPLYPLVLKLGQSITDEEFKIKSLDPNEPPVIQGGAAEYGITFNCFVIGIAFYWLGRYLTLIEADSFESLTTVLAFAACPLVLASTNRLHHDGVFGLLFMSAILSSLVLLQRPSIKTTVFATILWSAAVTVRYQGLLALGFAPLVYLLQYWLSPERASPVKELLSYRARCYVCLVAVVLLVGLPHFIRFYQATGTIFPGSLITPDEQIVNRSEFMAMVYGRTRLQVLGLLVISIPLLVWYNPVTIGVSFATVWKGEDEHKAPLMTVMLCGLLLFVIQLLFAYKQLRYFAATTPLLLAAIPCLLRGASRVPRAIFAATLAFSLLVMVTTSFLDIAKKLESSSIEPALYFYAPSIREWIPM